LRDDWDNIGQRQTDSGSVAFRALRVDDHELLRTPGPLGSPFASLRPCIAQLVLVNVYLGLAEGALAEGRRFTASSTRAWPAARVATAAEDPYLLHHYGELWVALAGARALADAAGAALDSAWVRGDALTPAERGACALAVAAAKVASTRAGLEVSSRIFEVTGARATTAGAGLDRFWRNLRTHTLHDPVDYKLRELGEWALAGTLPTPSFYASSATLTSIPPHALAAIAARWRWWSTTPVAKRRRSDPGGREGTPTALPSRRTPAGGGAALPGDRWRPCSFR
jgi:alkylation response protein AidB-like acyl-CoA dehydrogenase